MLASIEVSSLAIPFTVAFKHAAATRARTQALWVEARSQSGVSGSGEGCPREYVTSESLAGAQSFVHRHREEWLRTIGNLPSLVRWGEQHRAEVDANPAAWTAVELALLDLFGKLETKSVESLLDLPELDGRFRYSAVLGDAPPKQFESQLERYVTAGFDHFKIKLSGETGRDRAKLRAFDAARIAPSNVRADANNLWNDAASAIAALRALDFPFFALEEPLQPGDYEGMRRVGRACGARIVLDESLLREEQLDRIAGSPEHWIVNLRVSKMGGLLRSLDVLRTARDRDLNVIVGAQVGETSLLARAGLVVAQNARDLLVGQEGAFGANLLAADPVEPSITFAAGGTLDIAELRVSGRPGLGLSVLPSISGFLE